MKTQIELREMLRRIDRKSYPAYKSLKDQYSFPGYVLSIDHVQGDPFAAPSKVSIHMKGAQSAFPSDLYDLPHKRIALQDHLIRLMGQAIQKVSFQAKGSGKSGLITISRCGPEVIERTACQINPATGDMIVGLEIGFPANGRTVNSRELEKILFDLLTGCIKKTLYYNVLDHNQIKAVKNLAEDQQKIRESLNEMGLIAFIANGSILPRETGISDKPMKNSIPFESPESMAVTMELPHAGTITGMGIRRGITLIVGGGYHGKSTLLRALELGVYNHRKGDGREFVITDDSAMKIRAEDGRCVTNVDISSFIRDLPNKKDTVSFSTQDASGSTSQAANVVESIEAGSSVLLIDEDTSATNFMIRDELMQRVVHPGDEPIIPFIGRVRELYEQLGISSIIVAGSSGTYFHVADAIIRMDQYIPKEVTDFAKQEALKYPMVQSLKYPFVRPGFERIPLAGSEFKKDQRIKIKALGRDVVQINRNTIDLHNVEQLVDDEQTNALAYLFVYTQRELCGDNKNMQEIIEELLNRIEKTGLSAVAGTGVYHATLAMPRRQEIFACFNRYRQWHFKRTS